MSAPTLGRVVHFAYLWLREQREGRLEATKDRPCVVVLVDAETIPGAELVNYGTLTPRQADALRTLFEARASRVDRDDPASG